MLRQDSTRPQQRLALSQAGRTQTCSCDLLAARRSERPLCFQHRFGDSLIGPATAQIAAHAFAYALGIVSGLALLNQPDRAHDLARGAEPALQAVMGDKRLLHRVQPPFSREPFDRKDVRSVIAEGEREARIDTAAVDDNRARAALAAVAAFLGAGQVQPFT